MISGRSQSAAVLQALEQTQYSICVWSAGNFIGCCGRGAPARPDDQVFALVFQ